MAIITKTVGVGRDYTTIQEALTAIPAGVAGSNNVVQICADSLFGEKTYNETLASAKAYVTLCNRPGDIITINGSGKAQHTVLTTHNGSTLTSYLFNGAAGIGGLKITGADTYKFNWKYYGASDLVANGVTFYGGWAHIEASVGATNNSCLFGATTRSDAGAVLDQNGQFVTTFNNPIFKDFTVAASALIVIRQGTVNLNAPLFHGVAGKLVWLFPNSSTKALYLINGLPIDVAYGGNNHPIDNESTGGHTVVIKNTGTTAATYNPQSYPFIRGAYTDGGGNVANIMPKFISNRRPFTVSFEVDDAVNVDSAKALAVKAALYGWKLGWSINTKGMTQPVGQGSFSASPNAPLIRMVVSSQMGLATGNKVDISGVQGCTEANGPWIVTKIDTYTYDLQGSVFASLATGGLSGTVSMWRNAVEWVAAGHEIMSHGRRHVDVSNLKSFKIRSYAAGKTMTISNGVLTTTVPHTFVLSNYATVSSLITAILATGAYACSIDSSAYANDTVTANAYAGLASPLSFADVTAVSIETEHIVLQDQARYFDEELLGSKQDIEANIPGYTVRGYTCPGNYYNEELAAGARARGYANVRSTSGPANSMFKAEGFDLCNILASTTDTVRQDTLAHAKEDFIPMLNHAAYMGNFLVIYTHGVAYPFWNDLFDWVRASGAMVLPRGEADKYVRANGVADGSKRVFSRPGIDESDYRLQPISPCLGAGTKIAGLTTDIEGNPLFPPYNIGPFGLTEGALGVATVDYDGAPRNNITRLSGTSATINPTDTYKLADTNACRIVTEWVVGTANFAFDANGVPVSFTGQQLIDAGIGPRLYCGSKGIAGYTVDQDAAANAKIIRTLKVPTYIDTLYYSDFQEMDWSETSE